MSDDKMKIELHFAAINLICNRFYCLEKTELNENNDPFIYYFIEIFFATSAFQMSLYL